MIHPMVADTLFRVANQIESAVWGLFALGFGIAVFRHRGPGRWLLAAGSAAFLAFGITDIVETYTGAWWRPWWLLTWKGGCIAGIAYVVVRLTRIANSSPRRNAHASGGPDARE